MYDIEDVREVIRDLSNSSLIISPWLAYVGGKMRFDTYIFDQLYWGAREFVGAHWRREYLVRAFGALPLPTRYPRTAIYETAASTAVYLAYEKTGQPVVSDNDVRDALHLTEKFVFQHGFDYFVTAYAVITTYENHVALLYYGKMKEDDFLSGRLHRPWIDYELDDELIVSCELENTEIFVENDERYVRLTKQGERRAQAYWNVLNETGYLKKRSQSQRISHFSELEDYEQIVEHIAPSVSGLRQDFALFSDVRPGMKVLELGCGTGSFTFHSGLADMVGPTGEIIATDPAHKMIERAIQKRDQLGAHWVEFVQCRAESLPFPDDSFDAVTGMLFLHLTDIQTAVREIHRVLKPGGIFATLHPLSFPMKNPIVEAWFSPIAASLAKPAEETLLPEVHTVPDAMSPLFSDLSIRSKSTPNLYNNPDMVTRFYIESLGLFDDQLKGIPWAERTRLIEEVKANGKRICETYTTEELTVDYPSQCVRAFAVK